MALKFLRRAACLFFTSLTTADLTTSYRSSSSVPQLPASEPSQATSTSVEPSSLATLPIATPIVSNPNAAVLVYAESPSQIAHIYDIAPSQNAPGSGPTPSPCVAGGPGGVANWPLNIVQPSPADFPLISPEDGFTSHTINKQCKYMSNHFKIPGVFFCAGFPQAVQCVAPDVQQSKCNDSAGRIMTPWAYCAWYNPPSTSKCTLQSTDCIMFGCTPLCECSDGILAAATKASANSQGGGNGGWICPHPVVGA